MSTRVLLADNHKLFRQALRALLEQEPGISVVAEAEDGVSAIQQVRDLQPDVVIMDVVMPCLNGIEATRRILSAHPEVKVIALSLHEDTRFVEAMLSARAKGYLMKDMDSKALVQAIHRVAEGGTCFCARLRGQFSPPGHSS
ncbi:MAG: response regulator transcription factor [Acidobacteriota bacterium]